MPKEKGKKKTPPVLTDYQGLIKAALEDVKGIETFATGGKLEGAPLPGLSVKGVGPIGLPLSDAQAKHIIEKSTQAPFGRGAETVVDTSVRLCRQVEAADVELGRGFDAAVQKHAQKFCETLGAQKKGEELVEARLYKMVLYEEGGFFKAHKDTEKEPGMFGSLVVQVRY